MSPNWSTPLLSTGLLCDHGCIATFDKTSVTIKLSNNIILTGFQDPQTNLWHLPIAPIPVKNTLSTERNHPTTHHANNAYQTKTKQELVHCLHAACCSPVPSTWIKAIEQGHLITWPRLTAELFRKHLLKSAASIKGHLNQHPKNIQSTKPIPSDPIDSQQDMNPTPMEPNNKMHQAFTAIINMAGQVSTNLRRRFPITSSQGHKYLYVLYDYDSNAILVKPIKSKVKSEHLRAYNKVHQYLLDRGFHPHTQ
jgi:hypothetical protein